MCICEAVHVEGVLFAMPPFCVLQGIVLPVGVLWYSLTVVTVVTVVSATIMLGFVVSGLLAL